MPSTSVWFGRILILLGIIGYAYGLFNGNASPTALIPAIFGVILMILGHVAQSKESLRKHLMHGAVIIGLIGFLVPLWRIISKSFSGNAESGIGAVGLSFNFATAMLIAMSIICLVFVILCVKSFVDARKNR